MQDYLSTDVKEYLASKGNSETFVVGSSQEEIELATKWRMQVFRHAYPEFDYRKVSKKLRPTRGERKKLKQYKNASRVHAGDMFVCR